MTLTTFFLFEREIVFFMFDQSELNKRVEEKENIINFMLEQEAFRITSKILNELDMFTERESFDPGSMRYEYIVYVLTKDVKTEFISPQLIVYTNLDTERSLVDGVQFVVKQLIDKGFKVLRWRECYNGSDGSGVKIEISLKKRSLFERFCDWILYKLNSIGILKEIR